MGLLSKLKESLLGPTPDYKAIISQGGVLVDVRTPMEFKGGHAKGSVNIPLQELDGKVNRLKGKEVVLVCRSGARAGQAKGILKRNGITAYNAGPWQRVS